MGVIKACSVEEECRSERVSYEFNNNSLTLSTVKHNAGLCIVVS